MSYFKSTLFLNKDKSPEIFIFELSFILASKFIELKVKVKLLTFNLTSFCSSLTFASIYEESNSFPYLVNKTP